MAPMAGPVRKLNVLLIGAGGREHALAWRLKRSASLGNLFATGVSNPGIRALSRPIGFEFSMGELYRLEQVCRHEKIDLIVVGPEEPLAGGIADKLTSPATAVFGPLREAAMLEADKSFAKTLMRAAAIPTAEGRTFRDAEGAREYVTTREEAPVIKASGLAGGKGVFVPKTKEEALAAIDRIMVDREFGAAGDSVVLEERLEGREVSIFALVDGRNILVLDACHDHKRIGDGDTGPNTGGMGAFCPSPVIDAERMGLIEREILVPTIDALRREGVEYRGVLYAGIILTHAGPKVLEFNVRFGDPECQCLVRRITGDFVQLLYATATGRLGEMDDDAVGFDTDHVCCVVLASRGYPEAYEKGFPIEGIEEAEGVEGVTVFLAGVKKDKGGPLVTSGGRVLSVVGKGPTLAEARERAYRGAELIRFKGKTMRTDIAGARPTPARTGS